MALQLAKSADRQRKPLSYEEIATSKPFLFTVGPKKKEFTMPVALVAAQSPALERLVNGDFIEAQEHHAEFETVEEETFLRFVRYAYTGKYYEDEIDDPTPEDADDSAEGKADGEVEGEPTAKEEDIWGWGRVPTGTGKKAKQKHGNTAKIIVFQALGDKFTKKVAKLVADDAADSDHPDIRLGGLPTRNPFLSHAMVFVFADYWGIERLKVLALHSLGKALNEALITKKVARDQIVALIEYCCEDARPEKLMALVVAFAAFKLPQLWLSERFQEILGDNRELSVAVFRAIVESGL
ncbi:hypothetical protein QBC34DRAFT_413612 [Podospora aff. communis PSN243]|uniref:BTB domain-containing protein n=1 Tax=Podospora aff. communis PSN243 TaxID=3040156 RepID=A0AAV9GCN4_9PEZI|nr:hypothetical protein QBC34DRAFT_413612 [Podospora aff. communis PSN243]